MLSTLASRLRTTAAPMAARALTLGPETFGLGKTPYSDEMPLRSLADSLADAVAPEEALKALGKRAPEVSVHNCLPPFPFPLPAPPALRTH